MSLFQAMPDPTIRRSVDDDLPADATTTETIALLPGDAVTFDGTIGFGGDQDWIRVEVPAGAELQVGMDGLTFGDPLLRLYDADSRQIGFSDDANFLGERLNPFLNLPFAEAVTVYIGAQSWSSRQTGDYRLYIEAVTLPVLSAGESLDGALLGTGDRDQVSLALEADAAYALSVSYPSADFGIRVRGPLSTVLSREFVDGDTVDERSIVFLQDAAALNLVVEVGTFGIAGPSPYTLSLTALTTIAGTLEADVFTTGDTGSYGRLLAGDDTVTGGAGGDTLEGGGGDDVLSGAGGHDRLTGGLGQDSLDGGDGDDRLDGRVGDDTLTGGAGMDTLRGGPDNDRLDGGGDADTLEGGFGDDSILGGDGADLLRGSDGQDSLDGGAGDDTLEGGRDDDVLTGGAGADLFRFAPPGAEGDDSITDFTGGEDALDLSALGFANGNPVALFRISSLNDAGDMVLALGPGRTLTLEGVSDLGDLSGDAFIGGTLDADSIQGGAEAELIFGLAGADTIRGSVGSDTIVGGGGDDVIDGGVERDDLWGGLGNDSITGGGGRDTLSGANGLDTLDGGAGNDDLYGGAGADRLLGGDGDDFIFGGRGADALDGGAGNDDLYGDAGHDTLTGGAGEDYLVGGSGDDRLTGGADSDLFFYTNGDDTITDFDPAEDFLDLPFSLIDVPLDDITFQTAQGDLVLTFAPGRTLVLEGISELSEIESTILFF
ncbi:calcium-binding protein [Cognatishimia sp. F0-27]|uniref:calcium-binding protein n=1 Tax=Cognatishimia sp. F0-27 TaxID=2816855 RepID=UPI001E0DB2E9|nr:calcium-binding protein [Cognatishimia sp. F0-27]MCC1494745.1 hypothetical protein [Cognatishimia sp. F0-27]